MNIKALAQAYISCCHLDQTHLIKQVFDKSACIIDQTANKQFYVDDLIFQISQLHKICPNIKFELTDYALSNKNNLMINWRINPQSITDDIKRYINNRELDYHGVDILKISEVSSNNFMITNVKSYYNFSESKIIGSSKKLNKSEKLKTDLIFSKLISNIENNKTYLNPELRLHDMAEKIETSINILSKVINDYTGLNFNEFINQYRINEAIKEINRDYSNRTLLDIALSVGFNSQSVFNPAFKKITNLTPSQYIKKIKK